MEHTSKGWSESTGREIKSAGTATPFGRVFDEPGLAVDHVEALLADDLALAVFDRGAFVGHSDLLVTWPTLAGALDVGGLNEPHPAIKKLVNAARATFSLNAVVPSSSCFFLLGHGDLLSATLLGVRAAGLRALDVAGLDELHRSVDGFVQAALATGRGLGVDAVVTGDFPSFFRSCHDSPHVVWVAFATVHL